MTVIQYEVATVTPTLSDIRVDRVIKSRTPRVDAQAETKTRMRTRTTNTTRMALITKALLRLAMRMHRRCKDLDARGEVADKDGDEDKEDKGHGRTPPCSPASPRSAAPASSSLVCSAAPQVLRLQMFYASAGLPLSSII